MLIVNLLSTAELLGFDKHIPPFAITIDSDILKGVNYASGSAGLREETGKHLVIINNQFDFFILDWYSVT